jgi:hypothetical protein
MNGAPKKTKIICHEEKEGKSDIPHKRKVMYSVK